MSILAPARSGAPTRTDLDNTARGRQDRSSGLAPRRGGSVMAVAQVPTQVLASRLDQTQRQPAMPRGSYIDILA